LVVLPGAEGEERLLVRALGGAVSVVGRFREAWRGTKIVLERDETWSISIREPDGKVVPFIYVSAGLEFACAVRTDGTIVCWGNNDFGEATPPAP
jgi:alpha-tubulin suppressor-like RCC1 family protein